MIGDDFQYSLGPPDSGFSLFLAERTKKIHFIRHAEGEHNAETSRTGGNDCVLRGDKPASEHKLWDARLTEHGISQAHKLREHLATRPSGGRSFTAFDLVIVSPLTRTCETAFHIFGPGRKPGVPAFLDTGTAPPGSEEASRGERVPAPRILVREECRERWGEYVCDGRRPISEIIKEFPSFDFSEVAHDEDVFYEDARESDEHCCQRGQAFLQWLNKRPEKCIAVVTHSSFLRHIFSQYGGNLHKDDQRSLHKLAANCELRSLVMCSHGNKDGQDIPPMTTDRAAARSDTRIS